MVKGIRETYNMVGQTYENIGRGLFNNKTSVAAYEQVQHFIPYDVLPQRRGFGGDIQEASIQESWSKTFIHSMYGLKDVIAMEIIDRDQYAMINRWASSRGGALAEIYDTNDEYLAANFFQYIGFATTLPPNGTSDGQALFSTQHPQSPINPTPVQSNRPPIDLPLGNAGLQFARANLEQQRKANGLTIWKNMIDKLVYNPNIEEIALQLIHGDWVPNTADRNMNTLKRLDITPVSWPYWTASGSTNPLAYNSWFVMGKEHYCDWYVRKPVTFDQQKILGINSIMFASFQEQVLGASVWYGTCGSPGP